MKIFVINLDRNVKRMETVRNQLSALNLDFERISAVSGRDLTPIEWKEKSNRFIFWCVKGYSMRAGELGCALSHLHFYKLMVERKLPFACVLEDDATPRPVLSELLEYVAANIDGSKPQVVLLSHYRNELAGTQFGMRRVKQGICTDGYVITLPAAKKLLTKNYPVKGPSDSWGLWERKGWIELYQASPEGVNQMEGGYSSDVLGENATAVNVFKMGLVQRVVWKVSRLLGKTLAAIIYR